VLERAKTVRALDRAATAIGELKIKNNFDYEILTMMILNIVTQ
jgi:hypothetical protein